MKNFKKSNINDFFNIFFLYNIYVCFAVLILHILLYMLTMDSILFFFLIFILGPISALHLFLLENNMAYFFIIYAVFFVFFVFFYVISVIWKEDSLTSVASKNEKNLFILISFIVWFFCGYGVVFQGWIAGFS